MGYIEQKPQESCQAQKAAKNKKIFYNDYPNKDIETRIEERYWLLEQNILKKTNSN